MIIKTCELQLVSKKGKWANLQAEVRLITKDTAVVYEPQIGEANIRTQKSQIENWLHSGEFKGQYSCVLAEYQGCSVIVIRLRSIMSHRPMVGAV